LNNIAVIGSGGHARSAINLLLNIFNASRISIYDDSFSIHKEEKINYIPLVGCIDSIGSDHRIVIFIGNNFLRREYFLRFKERMVKENIFHAKSFQEAHIKIGTSNQFFANSYVGSQVSIGDNNIINTGSIIEHEVKIGSHNHISVGVKICGRAIVGNVCLIGAGSVVLDGISICDDVTIGAGAVVTKNIIKSGVYVGVPAIKIK
jgi:sugar O-acyltransferase (sialic acid O-acetyltransferase NeuD family)